MAISDISHRPRFLAEGNVYLPHLAVIEKIVDETYDTKTFHFNFKDERLKEEFSFQSGQFCFLSILGIDPPGGKVDSGTASPWGRC